MRSIGIGGSLLEWFMHYLKDRKQKVIIRGQTSELGNIKAGVPQGSVLGPLLFLIYINDLPDGIKSNIKLFADDATIYIDFENKTEAENKLNEDMKCIKVWADKWLVNFSPTKIQ